MKKMRRIASILLAMIMVLSMSISVFADGNYTITAPDTDHTYEIYQIFTGNLAEDKTLSNVKWGENGTGTTGETVDATTLTALKNVDKTANDTVKLEAILPYVDLELEPIATVTGGAKVSVSAGYYLIKDQDKSLDDKEDEVYTTYLVKIVGDVIIASKSDIPTVDKVIIDNGEVKANEASFGETVNYKITGTLPTNIADYKEYFYKFTDTLSKGLTYNEDLKVMIDTKEVTNYFYVNDAGAGAAGTTITVAIEDLLALNKLGNVEITSATKIVLTYSATLNKDAVIAGAGNPNDVYLEYSNDPNHSGTGTTETPTIPEKEPTTDNPTGKTPKKEVVTYVTELTINKQDEKGNSLPGVEFTLTCHNGGTIVIVTEEVFVEDADGTYYKLNDGTYTEEAPPEETIDHYADTTTKYKKEIQAVEKTIDGSKNVVGTVAADGTLTFTGLGAGKYTLTETKTPTGYNTIEPITFTITFANGKFTSDNTQIVVESDNTFKTTIVNYKGAVLPETGGMGTTIFYIAGAVMVLGAAVIMITRKRMSE